MDYLPMGARDTMVAAAVVALMALLFGAGAISAGHLAGTSCLGFLAAMFAFLAWEGMRGLRLSVDRDGRTLRVARTRWPWSPSSWEQFPMELVRGIRVVRRKNDDQYSYVVALVLEGRGEVTLWHHGAVSKDVAHEAAVRLEMLLARARGHEPSSAGPRLS